MKIKLIATENCDEDAVTVSNDFEFPNRMSKCRLLQKHKSCLPQTPIKRASAIAAYLKRKSQTVQIIEEKNMISTPEDKLASTVVENMKETIKKAKHRRSDEARAALT